ncbi:MAG: SpoIIE family protein phosphatase, partial [Schwartzia sp.]|nr:SpoIIE family protein phosphatase [Schwartzia sp. (in: firmicutes)]
GFVETFAGEQARRRLSSHVGDKALLIEREFEHTRRDAEEIAQTMNLILAAQGDYLPRALPDPHTETVASGEPYLNMSRAVEAGGVDEEARRKMGVAANIADSLAVRNRFYTGVFVGSKDGWLIAADVTKDGAPARFSEKFLDSYDPREMNWYKLAAEAGKTIFTDLYVDTNGTRCITCATPFYDEDGFAGVVGVDCNAEEIYQQAVDMNSAGATDVSFILNKRGEILFSTKREGTLAVADKPRDLRNCGDKRLEMEASAMASGKNDVSLVSIDGEGVYLAYAPMASIGWSFGQVIAQTEVTYPARYAKDNLQTQMREFAGDVRGNVRRLAGVGAAFLLLALLAIVALSVKASGHFVRPILSLTEGVNEIAQGNLDRKLDVHTGDEIERLADCVNDMTDNLKTHIENLAKATAEKEHIKAELSVAQRIQEGMLPAVSSVLSGQTAFDLDAGMTPAKEVGGDFYDFYMLDENRLAVAIADVSGKGVPAALFMVVAKTVLENCTLSAKPEESLADVVARANDRISQNNDQMMFVTVFFGVLDLRTGVFDYVNAGHNPPLAALGGEPFAYLVPEGKPDKPLGVMEGLAFHQRSLTLAAGDALFFYTDGVTEAVDEKAELYGEGRLKAALDREVNPLPSMKELLAAVRQDMSAHVGEAEQSDDITMMALRYSAERRPIA